MSELSGVAWCERFPTSKAIEDLSPSFSRCVERFITALKAGGATVCIAATFRPPQRAYLMHHCWAIARENADVTGIPVMAGVDIEWAHTSGNGAVDRAMSHTAAEAMVNRYSMQFRAALASRHTERRAIDMSMSWNGELTILDANNESIRIATTPRDGTNPMLHRVGATYGVMKLVTDPPHWSEDGH